MGGGCLVVVMFLFWEGTFFLNVGLTISKEKSKSNKTGRILIYLFYQLCLDGPAGSYRIHFVYGIKYIHLLSDFLAHYFEKNNNNALY